MAKTKKKKFKVEGGQLPQNETEKLRTEIAQKLKDIKQANDTVPYYKPRFFSEQFYLYKNATTYRLYIYINNEWKYIALT